MPTGGQFAMILAAHALGLAPVFLGAVTQQGQQDWPLVPRRALPR